MMKFRYAAVLVVVIPLCFGLAQEKKPADGILFSESFDDDQLEKRGWYDGSKFRINTTNPYATKGCAEYEWKEKTETPFSTGGVRRLFEPSETVYMRAYWRLSKGWKWSGQTYHPHLMHFMTTENTKFHGPALSHLTLYIEPVGGKLLLGTQDRQNAKMPHGLTQGPLRGGFNGKSYTSEEKLFQDDKWHCIEAQFTLNSLDLDKDQPNADGIIRGWFDDKLVIEETKVIFRSTDFPKMKFNQFLITPYFGEGLLPQAQALWVDEVAVGTKRIGPLKK